MKFIVLCFLILLSACEYTEVTEVLDPNVKLRVVCKGSGFLYENYRRSFSLSAYESEQDYMNAQNAVQYYEGSSYYPDFTLTGLKPLQYWIRIFAAETDWSKTYIYIEHNQNRENRLTLPLMENSSTSVEINTETVIVSAFQLEEIIINSENPAINEWTEWNLKFCKYHDPVQCCQTIILNEWNITGPSFPLSLPDVSHSLINLGKNYNGPFYYLQISSRNPDYSITIDLDLVSMLKYSRVFSDSLKSRDVAGDLDITYKGAWTTLVY